MSASPNDVGSIGAEDIDALNAGANFYSAAVGDSTRTALTTWLEELLQEKGPVTLLRPEALAPQTPCAAVCVIGSALALADLPPSGDEFAQAVHRLERVRQVEFGAIYPIAAATVSAHLAVVAAAQLGVPLLDADGMGGVYALIHHTSMYLSGVSPTPLVAFGATGESVTIEVDDGPRVDRLLRGNVDVLGGWAALAAYPASAETIRRSVLPGTVSRLITIGRLLREVSDPGVLVERLSDIAGCRRLARGRIVEFEHLSRAADITIPAHPSSVVIEETEGLRRQLRAEMRNEIVAIFADGELIAAAPDRLALMDVSRANFTALDSMEVGDLVDVLATPADAVWYSPAGLQMVGLASHGIPLAHPGRR